MNDTPYKFTAKNGKSPYGVGSWKIGKPRSTRKPLVGCQSGIHYCRPEHLGWWINEELYTFEDLTPDESFEHEGTKMVTRKGVCVARVEAWTPEAAQTLTFRIADRAIRVHAVSGCTPPGWTSRRITLAALPTINSQDAVGRGDAAGPRTPPGPREPPSREPPGREDAAGPRGRRGREDAAGAAGTPLGREVRRAGPRGRRQGREKRRQGREERRRAARRRRAAEPSPRGRRFTPPVSPSIGGSPTRCED